MNTEPYDLKSITLCASTYFVYIFNRINFHWMGVVTGWSFDPHWILTICEYGLAISGFSYNVLKLIDFIKSKFLKPKKHEDKKDVN